LPHHGHQIPATSCVEAVQEITDRRRSRNASSPQCIEKCNIVSLSLQVVDTLATRQDVELNNILKSRAFFYLGINIGALKRWI
jgi:hypothetical protein